MKNLLPKLVAIAMMVGLSFGAGSAPAAGAGLQPDRQSWSFSGPLGKFDRAQLQRGYKVYREVCASCHAMSLAKFRNLAQPGGPEFSTAQIVNLAAEFQIKDGPNEQGEMFERPGRPSDAFPSPFPNPQAARAANGGAYPPDMSVLAKARSYSRGFPWFLTDVVAQYQEHGPDYIVALLTGYLDEPPAGVTLAAGQYYNKYMSGNLIAMPNVLNDGQIEYTKGADGKPSAPETKLQYAKDVTAFMAWMAEPQMEARKRIGFQMMAILLILAGLLYFTKKKIWSRLPEHSGAH